MKTKEIVAAAEAVVKKYPAGGIGPKKAGPVRAVDGVSLAVARGEILGVVGESGCGKSTLGRCLMGLTPVTEGKVIFEGTDITSFSPRQMKPYRKKMQMIFQNPLASFDPRQRLDKALAEAGHVWGMEREETLSRIAGLAGAVGLEGEILQRRPSELSGGQLQRVAIARALLCDPSFIVADEPVSSLDVSVQAQILNLITDLRKERELTMLFISHEMAVVEHICDRAVVMYLGQIVESADTQELFRNASHPYTKTLMSAVPVHDPRLRKEKAVPKGDVPAFAGEIKGCPFAPRCGECTKVCLEKRPPLVGIGNDHLAACHHLK